MKIEYDEDAHTLYIRLQAKERGETLEVNEELNIDLDNEGNIIGIEILNPEDYPLQAILSPTVERYGRSEAEVVRPKIRRK